MKLKEYQGKELFKKYNIPIPKGELIISIEPDPSKLAKAQVLEGKRKKKGLIKPATEENLKEIFKHCKEILLEEKLDIEKEYYLALTIDRELKDIVVLFSEQGGIDIEEQKNIQKTSYNKFSNEKFLPIIKSMYKLMKEHNALLVEINPLVLSKNQLIAVDAKIILDDNVNYSKSDLNYVDLDGDIAIIGNGAGLVMATLDMIAYFGGKASNFLDIGGGASVEKMEKAIERVLKKNPKVIFINIFGGMTKCDDIAKALINYKNEINIPMIVRIIGTNQELAQELLSKNNIQTYNSMEICAKKAVENVK